jgi:c-di-GMP-binding flagellar brake protein YcgR
MCFRLSIWPNGHRESQKYEFEKGRGRTNEAIGLIVFSLIQPKRMLFVFKRVAYSVPEEH